MGDAANSLRVGDSVRIFNRFRADRSGAITADYIVLTGAIIALVLTTMNAISQGTFDGIADIADHIKPDGCVVTGGGTTDLSACN